MDDRHESALTELAEMGHILGPWMPESRTHKRRACVIPGCVYIERLDVSKVPS